MMTVRLQALEGLVPPEQHAAISSIADMELAMEFPADGQTDLTTHVQSVYAQFRASIRPVFGSLLAQRSSPSTLATPEDFEDFQRLQLGRHVMLETVLRSATMLLAATAGDCLEEEGELAVIASTHADLTNKRAQSNAIAIIGGALPLWTPVDALGEEVSLWDRALAAYNSQDLLSPPTEVSDRDAGMITEATAQIETADYSAITRPFMPSKHKAVTLFRAIKFQRQYTKRLKESPMPPAEEIAASLEMMISMVPDAGLSPKQMNMSRKAVKNMRRYIKSAGRFEPAIREDSRLKYLGVMLELLPEIDIAAEKAVFERNAYKFHRIAR